jgi:hypothetical protein
MTSLKASRMMPPLIDWSKMILMKSDLSLYVNVPAPATDLQIERAKILWMLIRHHGVQVKREEWIAIAA